MRVLVVEAVFQCRRNMLLASIGGMLIVIDTCRYHCGELWADNSSFPFLLLPLARRALHPFDLMSTRLADACSGHRVENRHARTKGMHTTPAAEDLLCPEIDTAITCFHDSKPFRFLRRN